MTFTITIPNHPTPCTDHPDPDLWFDPDRRDEAAEHCVDCWFSDRCRTLAATEDHGVWGGVDAGLPKYGREDIIPLWMEGYRQAEIIRMTGLTKSVIFREIKKFTRGPERAKEGDPVVARFLEVGSVKEIADEFGLSLRQAQRRLAGVPRPLCKNGHRRTPETTHRRSDGILECIPCRRKNRREWKARKRVERLMAEEAA